MPRKVVAPRRLGAARGRRSVPRSWRRRRGGRTRFRRVALPVPSRRLRASVPQAASDYPAAAPAAAPELSLEDPLVRATRDALRRLVGQRVQLLIAGQAVPEIGPWDTDGMLTGVGESLVALRPGHGPNAGREIRFSLHSVLGFIPLPGMDPGMPR